MKWYKVQPDCRINQNTDLGNEHGRRDKQERMGPGMKVKRSLQHLKKGQKENLSAQKVDLKDGGRKTAVL